jgi:hypothetical protein
MSIIIVNVIKGFVSYIGNMKCFFCDVGTLCLNTFEVHFIFQILHFCESINM